MGSLAFSLADQQKNRKITAKSKKIYSVLTIKSRTISKAAKGIQTLDLIILVSPQPSLDLKRDTGIATIPDNCLNHQSDKVFANSKPLHKSPI
jgi:hypothetical protein